MAGLKEIRTRIGSVKTTRQVTSAMKLVSAAKLKKAQDAVIGLRPYARKYLEIFDTVCTRIKNLPPSEFLSAREPGKILFVLVTSNRGLCGSFNSAITAKAVGLALSDYDKQLDSNQLQFLVIGKQGQRRLKNYNMPVAGNRNDLMDKLSFSAADRVVGEIMDDFRNGVFDRVELFYNNFINATQFAPVHEQFLPLVLPAVNNRDEKGDLLLEPYGQEMLPQLIPARLKIQFYKALLVSLTAEHGARMTAMHQATDNANELLEELVLQYNKARQAAITGEILEITGGAEAQSH